MGHTVTGKLNKAANEHQSPKGVTFFVRIGEKNYNYKNREAEWTNYTAALFASDTQVDFYRSTLVPGTILSVSGDGIIVKLSDDPQYKPDLLIQNAKLEYIYSPDGQQAPGVRPAQRAAPQQPGNTRPPSEPLAPDSFDDDIPF